MLSEQNMKAILVKTHNESKTLQEVRVITQDGRPTIIKAERHLNYEFFDESIGHAPNHIITKRMGNDLYVSFEENGQEVDLIIESFYDYPESALIGISENSSYYYYVPDTGEVEDYVTQLKAEEIEGQALGGEHVAAPLWLPIPSGFHFPWWVPLLLVPLIPALTDKDDDLPTSQSTSTSPDHKVGTFGEAVTQNVTNNDTNVDATTVRLIDPLTHQTSDTVYVPGQGTWTVKAGTDEVTFTPDAGFSANPTPINYTVKDKLGNQSSPTAVAVEYPAQTTADRVPGELGQPVTVDVVANDSNVDAKTIKLINPKTSEPSTDKVFVEGEGTWELVKDSSGNPTGKVTFTPIPGFYGDPTPINYVVNNTNGAPQNPTPVSIDYPSTSVPDVAIGVPGQPVTQNVTSNDGNGGKDVDPSSVQLIDPKNPNTPTDSVTIPGQGTWKTGPNPGEVTFTPETGFSGDPDPITYIVKDKTGTTLPPTTVDVNYIDNIVTLPDTKPGVLGQPVTLEVLDNDSRSADSSTLKLIDPNTNKPTDSVVVAGQGTWSVDKDATGKPNGNVTFTPATGFENNPSPVNYIVNSTTGKTSEPTPINVIYPNEARVDIPVVPPTPNTPNNAGNPNAFGDITVAEDSTASGSFTVVAGRNTASISQILVSDKNGQMVSVPLTVNPTAPVEIETARGKLTITDFDPSTGKVNYIYDPEIQNHRDDKGNPTDEPVMDAIKISVTDSNGKEGSGILDIAITDSLPVAQDDTIALAPGKTDATGNLFTNDSFGADGKGVFTEQTLEGKYGNLTIDVNGQYTYTLDPTKVQAAKANGDDFSSDDVFSYTITDNDGDTSTAKLTVVKPVNTITLSVTTTDATAIEGTDNNTVAFQVKQDTAINGVTKVHVAADSLNVKSPVSAQDFESITVTSPDGQVTNVTPEDFFAKGVDVNVPANSTEGPTITFKVKDDTDYEKTENLKLVISSPENPVSKVTLGTSEASAVVFDEPGLTDPNQPESPTNPPKTPVGTDPNQPIGPNNPPVDTDGDKPAGTAAVSVATTDDTAIEGTDNNTVAFQVKQDTAINGVTKVHVAADSLNVKSPVSAEDFESITVTSPDGQVTNVTPADFFAKGVDVNVPANSTEGPTITFKVKDDTDYEKTENLKLVISNPENPVSQVTLGTSEASAVVFDEPSLTDPNQPESPTNPPKTPVGTDPNQPIGPNNPPVDTDGDKPRIDSPNQDPRNPNDPAAKVAGLGSVVEGSSSILSGSLKVSNPNAVTAVTINDQDVTNASSKTPVVITTNGGTLTVTGYDKARGELNYTYQENGKAKDHTAGNGVNADNQVGSAADKLVSDAFTLKVLSKHGVADTKDLVISIMDTAPVAVADTNSVVEDSRNSITGNVLVGKVNAGDKADTLGADKTTVTGVQAGNVTTEVSSGVGKTITGTYGKLMLNADGTYSYVLDEVKADKLNTGDNVQDVFSYTIKDADGDSSTTTLTINVAGKNEPTVRITGPDEVQESVGKAVYTVTLSEPTSANVTVTYKVSNGNTKGTNPTEQADFGSGVVVDKEVTVTIQAGQTSAKIELPITNDTVYEGPERYTVSLVSATHAIVDSSANKVETTIYDNGQGKGTPETRDKDNLTLQLEPPAHVSEEGLPGGQADTSPTNVDKTNATKTTGNITLKNIAFESLGNISVQLQTPPTNIKYKGKAVNWVHNDNYTEWTAYADAAQQTDANRIMSIKVSSAGTQSEDAQSPGNGVLTYSYTTELFKPIDHPTTQDPSNPKIGYEDNLNVNFTVKVLEKSSGVTLLEEVKSVVVVEDDMPAKDTVVHNIQVPHDVVTMSSLKAGFTNAKYTSSGVSSTVDQLYVSADKDSNAALKKTAGVFYEDWVENRVQDGYTTGKVSGNPVTLTGQQKDNVLAERIWWGSFPNDGIAREKGFYMMEDDSAMKVMKSLEDLEQNVSFGTFTHQNYTTTGTLLSSVNLKVDFKVNINGIEVNMPTLNFNTSHFETINVTATNTGTKYTSFKTIDDVNNPSSKVTVPASASGLVEYNRVDEKAADFAIMKQDNQIIQIGSTTYQMVVDGLLHKSIKDKVTANETLFKAGGAAAVAKFAELAKEAMAYKYFDTKVTGTHIPLVTGKDTLPDDNPYVQEITKGGPKALGIATKAIAAYEQMKNLMFLEMASEANYDANTSNPKLDPGAITPAMKDSLKANFGKDVITDLQALNLAKISDINERLAKAQAFLDKYDMVIGHSHENGQNSFSVEAHLQPLTPRIQLETNLSVLGKVHIGADLATNSTVDWVASVGGDITNVEKQGNTTTITTKYGVLTGHTDGSYTFLGSDALPRLVAEGATDKFTFHYSYQDNDGDKVISDISFNFKGLNANEMTQNGRADLDMTVNDADSNDYLFGSSKDDVIKGGKGDDVLVGEAGADELHGGAGNDVLFFDKNDTVIDGGAGYDTLSLGSWLEVKEGTTNQFLPLDFTNALYYGNVKHIEALDLRGDYHPKDGKDTEIAQTLNISKDAVVSMTDVLSNGGHELFIEGSSKDSVNLSGGFIAKGNTYTKDGHTYDTYVSGNVTVYVATDIKDGIL